MCSGLASSGSSSEYLQRELRGSRASSRLGCRQQRCPEGRAVPRRLPLGQEGLPAQLPWEVSSPGEPGLRVGAELIAKRDAPAAHGADVAALPLCCPAALLPVLLVHAAASPLFHTKAAPVFTQGEEKVSGEVLGTACRARCPDMRSLFPPGQQRIRICHRHVLGREQHVYRI